MQRGEKGSSNRDYFPSQMQLSVTSGTMLTNTRSAASNSTSRNRKSKSYDNKRPWKDLPEELLDRISSHMRIPEYLNLGRVCPDWRSYFLASNKKFMKSLPPLVCYISASDENSCLFYDLSNGNKYQARLPYFGSKFCFGLSCGYIIMGEFFRNFWFINPVTGHQHLFSSMPRQDYVMDRSDRFIFASTTGANDQDTTLIVVLSRSHYCIWFRRSIDTQWSAYTFASKAWILDMVVFNAKVFVITAQFQIGILSLRSFDVRFLNFSCVPRECINLMFVTSNDQLFVVDFWPLIGLKIFKIDFSTMKWVSVDNLGDQALFLGDMMGVGIHSTTRWGGRGNCVYYLPLASNKVYIYSCSGQYLDRITIVGGDSTVPARLRCWYFLDQSHNIDYVRDE